jgi:hypothetical protein
MQNDQFSLLALMQSGAVESGADGTRLSLVFSSLYGALFSSIQP